MTVRYPVTSTISSRATGDIPPTAGGSGGSPPRASTAGLTRLRSAPLRSVTPHHLAAGAVLVLLRPPQQPSPPVLQSRPGDWRATQAGYPSEVNAGTPPSGGEAYGEPDFAPLPGRRRGSR